MYDSSFLFTRNEYLAVRNAEGGFYVCQAMQNVYRTTRKIKIRWLSQDMKVDPSGETYKPDFYDVTGTYNYSIYTFYNVRKFLNVMFFF